MYLPQYLAKRELERATFSEIFGRAFELEMAKINTLFGKDQMSSRKTSQSYEMLVFTLLSHHQNNWFCSVYFNSLHQLFLTDKNVSDLAT